MKQAVARAAVEYAKGGIIGVGTGSTANYFIDALAEVKGRIDGAVASSEATAARLKGHGIDVLDLNSVDGLEVYVDGAERGGATLETRTSLRAQREATEQRDVPDSRFVNDTLTLANTWTWRRVDSITNPRRGDVITLTGAVGVSRSGLSDLLAESFVYGYGRYVRYFPVFDRHQVILRGEIGHVVTDDLRFVPADYRFRTGGSGSVRGYQYQSLGVKEGSSVTGADSLIVGSAEYVHWFTPTWGSAVFYDVGDADNELEKIRWARGYGAGLRYRTVAGPLALDVAYGERDKEWRVHFAIAVAF